MKQRKICKTLAVAVILLFIGLGLQPVIADRFPIKPVRDGNTLFVGGTGEGNYSSIQDAIDNASNGDTVFVYNGTYYENILIDKSINLVGENKSNTVIDGGGIYGFDVIHVSFDRVTISGFLIQNSGKWHMEDAGIDIRSNNNIITGNNIIMNNKHGILLLYSNNNSITNNIIKWNYACGIWLIHSNNNTISENKIFKNNQSSGIILSESSNNSILNNNIYKNNGSGINSGDSHNNSFIDNTIISNNRIGIHFCVCNNNTIANNTISNQSNGLWIRTSTQNRIINNYITSNNEKGIAFFDSIFNVIYNNEIFYNGDGGDGVYLDSSANNTIIENNLKDTIYLNKSNKNSIIYNNISSNFFGIYIYYSNNNTITCNNIFDNYKGLQFDNSNGNTITRNIISNKYKYYGIFLDNSRKNFISDNSFFNDGFYVLFSYENTVTNNTINDKPLIYLEDKSDITIGNAENAGQVILINCNNISILNQEISHTTVGIELWDSHNCRILYNKISNNKEGIYLFYSNDNLIQKNDFHDNERDAFFIGGILKGKNIWKQNYWNRPRILPKLIFGRIIIYTLVTWINIDWTPAKEPYDIDV